jgi:hypothetical protein
MQSFIVDPRADRGVRHPGGRKTHRNSPRAGGPNSDAIGPENVGPANEYVAARGTDHVATGRI